MNIGVEVLKGKRNQSAVTVKRLDGLRVCCKQR